MQLIAILFIACTLIASGCGFPDPPPPPPNYGQTGEIILQLFPNLSDGATPCQLLPTHKQWIYIQIWSYEFNTHQHIKYGNTIRRTEQDIGPDGKLSGIQIPKEGTYYLDIKIVKDCDECCGGNLSSNTVHKCNPDERKGKPEWEQKTNPTTWKPTELISVRFNTCKCEC